ncbi:MAG: NAD-dependent epimerase/dehydratase family protein [Clostridiales bacterium]|nr:NAD-dependent epimerase/dehydratase family protein [Clostridiales bacterium]
MDKSLTYIVTGCTGYVGNQLTKKLLAEGCKVYGLARSKQKVNKIFGDNAPNIVYGDITNLSDVERLFVGEGPFVVINTVAKVSIDNSQLDELYSVTVGGTKNLVSACKKFSVKKLLHISSTSSLPKNFCEEDLKNYIPTPQSLNRGYAQAKALADEIVLQATREGLDASILFFASVLGPGDYSNSHMSQLMLDFANGKLPASVNGGYNDFDIRDVAEVLFNIINNSKRGECYIFANRPCKINEILGYLAEHLGKKNLVALPMWVAYAGLPFLWLYAKITKTRPLYTKAALSAIAQNADFPITKSKLEFGFNPRPLKQTVIDHFEFLTLNKGE